MAGAGQEVRGGGVTSWLLVSMLLLPVVLAVDLADIDGYTPIMFRPSTITFCKMDWEAYQKEPWLEPMMRIRIKKDCNKVKTLRVHEVEKLMALPEVSFLKPSGFVFHIARCGSTLMANAMACSPNSRTYSESQALMSAIHEGHTFEEQVKSLQMAVKLMGLVTPSLSHHKHLFFKHQSINTSRLNVFQAAFPDVPWVLIIRKPEEILGSMFRLKSKARNAPCLRYANHPYKALSDIATEKKLTLRFATPKQLCAAHEGALMLSGIRALEEAGPNRAAIVDYEQLLDHSFPAVIIQKHFNVTLTDQEVQKVKLTSQQYSKGSFDRAHVYKDDSKAKHDWAEREGATTHVERYAQEYYDALHSKLFKPSA